MGKFQYLLLKINLLANKKGKKGKKKGTGNFKFALTPIRKPSSLPVIP
jgi:hypothetical protein